MFLAFRAVRCMLGIAIRRQPLAVLVILSAPPFALVFLALGVVTLVAHFAGNGMMLPQLGGIGGGVFAQILDEWWLLLFIVSVSAWFVIMTATNRLVVRVASAITLYLLSRAVAAPQLRPINHQHDERLIFVTSAGLQILRPAVALLVTVQQVPVFLASFVITAIFSPLLFGALLAGVVVVASLVIHGQRHIRGVQIRIAKQKSQWTTAMKTVQDRPSAEVGCFIDQSSAREKLISLHASYQELFRYGVRTSSLTRALILVGVGFLIALLDTFPFLQTAQIPAALVAYGFVGIAASTSTAVTNLVTLLRFADPIMTALRVSNLLALDLHEGNDVDPENRALSGVYVFYWRQASSGECSVSRPMNRLEMASLQEKGLKASNLLTQVGAHYEVDPVDL